MIIVELWEHAGAVGLERDQPRLRDSAAFVFIIATYSIFLYTFLFFFFFALFLCF